jgi:hypothetical protein
MRPSGLLLAAWLAFGLASDALGHEVRPGYLSLRQTDATTYNVLWKVPAIGERRLAIHPRFPENCAPTAEPVTFEAAGSHNERVTMRCTGGLVARSIAIDGLAATMTDVIVRLSGVDNSAQTLRLTPSEPSFIVEAAPSQWDVAATYLKLGVEAQLKFQELRLAQMQQLQAGGSGRRFDVDQRQAEAEQLRAQLDAAKYDLDQTTIRAPADGYVGSLALNKGDRAAPLKSVMSFIVSDRIQLVGIFSQNGFQTIKPGAKMQFALSNNPGHLYSSTIGDVVSGVGEGQIASSGTLARVTALPMTVEYAALINRPEEIDPSALRPGMSGTATVYAPGSAPLDKIGWLLLYARALVLYL